MIEPDDRSQQAGCLITGCGVLFISSVISLIVASVEALTRRFGMGKSTTLLEFVNRASHFNLFVFSGIILLTLAINLVRWIVSRRTGPKAQ